MHPTISELSAEEREWIEHQIEAAAAFVTSGGLARPSPDGSALLRAMQRR